MASVCTHSSYNTLLVKTGYKKQDCVVTQLSTLIYENHRDKTMTAGEKTFRDVIWWNLREIIVLEINGEIESRGTVENKNEQPMIFILRTNDRAKKRHTEKIYYSGVGMYSFLLQYFPSKNWI